MFSHHGTGYNQRDYDAVQLQAEHSKVALGREGQQGESREARDINLAFDNIKHYQRLSGSETCATAEMVRNAYWSIGTEYETLLKAFDRENKVSRNVWGKIVQWPPTTPEWCVGFPNIEEKTENCRRILQSF